MAFLSSFYPQPVVAGTTEGTFAEGDDPRFGDGLEEAPEDGTPYARKDADWTPTVGLEEDGSIAAIVQVRQGTAAELGEIVLNDGEISIELVGGVAKQFRVGDGATSGGIIPSGWTVISGTSDEDQSVTNNSSSLVAIDFFKNLAVLQLGAFYQFFGTAKFSVVGAGGISVNAGDFANQGAFIMLGAYSDWPNAPSVVPSGSVTISDAEDFGYIHFQGFYTPTSSESLYFPMFFRQQSASAAGTASFLGDDSYFGYQKIT
jgi:hypothetical protein